MKEVLEPDKHIRDLILPEIPETGITYIPSQYVIPVEYNSLPCLFNTFTRQCVEAVLPASALAGEGHDDLIRARFLVPEELDESAYYLYVFSLMRMARPDTGVASYTILPTFACNARCIYCYEEGMKPVSMTEETQAQTLRFIMNTRRTKNVRLHWFGGEPLLRPDVIDRICLGLREAEIPYRSGMISNGSLITPEIIEKMTGLWRLMEIQISMDGAEEDYIERKRYTAYDRTYQRVMESAGSMSKEGIRVSIRCNVDGKNWKNIPRFLEDLEANVHDKRRVSVYFAPLNEVREGENAIPLWKEILKANQMIGEAGFGSSIPGKFTQHFRLNHCMADSDAPVIAPDGSLYACEHCTANARYGNIWNGVTDEAAKNEFCRIDFIREKCRSCPYLPLCTPFRSCPTQDRDCREIMKHTTANLMHQDFQLCSRP